MAGLRENFLSNPEVTPETLTFEIDKPIENLAYRKYYKTYIKAKHIYPDRAPVPITHDPLPPIPNTSYVLGDNVSSTNIDNIKLKIKKYNNTTEISPINIYSNNILVQGYDESFINNRENITELPINITNEYTSFRDIHYYFTRFLYYYTPQIYDKIFRMVISNNYNFSNCNYEFRDEDLKKRNVFRNVLLNMCKYKYRLIHANEYIKGKFSIENASYIENDYVVFPSEDEAKKLPLIKGILYEGAKGEQEHYREKRLKGRGILRATINTARSSLKPVVKGYDILNSTLSRLGLKEETKGYKEHEYKTKEDIDKYIHVWYSDLLEHYIVIFKGTSDNTDKATDAKALFTSLHEAHRFTNDRYIYLTFINEYIKRQSQQTTQINETLITFAGHSLGGLIAKYINRSLIDSELPYLVITYNYFAMGFANLENTNKSCNEFDIFTFNYDMAGFNYYINNPDYPNDLYLFKTNSIMSKSVSKMYNEHSLFNIGKNLYRDNKFDDYEIKQALINEYSRLLSRTGGGIVNKFIDKEYNKIKNKIKRQLNKNDNKNNNIILNNIILCMIILVSTFLQK